VYAVGLRAALCFKCAASLGGLKFEQACGLACQPRTDSPPSSDTRRVEMRQMRSSLSATCARRNRLPSYTLAIIPLANQPSRQQQDSSIAICMLRRWAAVFVAVHQSAMYTSPSLLHMRWHPGKAPENYTVPLRPSSTPIRLHRRAQVSGIIKCKGWNVRERCTVFVHQIVDVARRFQRLMHTTMSCHDRSLRRCML